MNEKARGVAGFSITDIRTCSIEEAKKSFAGLASKDALELDPDLMYVRFIMCHEGTNENGDTFTKEVLKRAEKTPRNKPIRWEHGEPVIGTILDSQYAEDETGRGYIEAIGVIWKFIYPEYADDIKQKAMTNELRLSMECYFTDAYYMYRDTIIDQDSAEFLGLDDYLGREIMGNKVIRVFKDVLFGGVGVVANPADKEAVFLSVAKKKEEQEDETAEKAIAEDLERPVNDFTNREITDKDVNNALIASMFVKALDDAKSAIVSRFKKNTYATKEQMLAELSGIINNLFNALNQIGDKYMNGSIAIAKGGESEETMTDSLGDKNNEPSLASTKEENEMDEKEKVSSAVEEQTELTNELEDQAQASDNVEGAEQETATSDVTEEQENQAEASTEEQQEQQEEEQIDYGATIAQLQGEIDRLKAELEQEREARASAEQQYQDLLAKVEAQEKEAKAKSRLAELEALGIEFSESRKQKELEKLSAMSDEDFVDYKETLAEVIGKKAEASSENDEAKIVVASEKQPQLIIEYASSSDDEIKPFGHLA